MTFKEWYYKVIIAEMICITAILLSVFIIKYFFKSEFWEVKNFYYKYVTADTDVNEVLKNEN